MTGVLHRMAIRLGLRPRPLAGPTYAVFARIDDPLMPLQRGRKYEDPLNRILRRAGLGRVTGGGSVQALGGGISWVSLDLHLVEGDAVLAFVSARLRELGAPPGSVLRYRKGDQVISVSIW